jgi:hypothetical protein
MKQKKGRDAGGRQSRAEGGCRACVHARDSRADSTAAR